MKAASIGTRRLALIGLGILLVAAMSYVVMRSGPLAPTRVTVVQAAEGQITPQLFGIGTVEARRSYLIGPTTAGRVRSVTVDVGDTVKTGQPVAEMDPVDLDERTAALDASVARVFQGTRVVSTSELRQVNPTNPTQADVIGNGTYESGYWMGGLSVAFLPGWGASTAKLGKPEATLDTSIEEGY